MTARWRRFGFRHLLAGLALGYGVATFVLTGSAERSLSGSLAVACAMLIPAALIFSEQRAGGRGWRGALVGLALVAAMASCSIATGYRGPDSDGSGYNEPLYRGG